MDIRVGYMLGISPGTRAALQPSCPRRWGPSTL